VTADRPGATVLAAGKPGEGPWGATPQVFATTLKEFTVALAREQFGPAGIVISYPSVEDLLPVLSALPGNLAVTVHLDASDEQLARQLLPVLERIAGTAAIRRWLVPVAYQNYAPDLLPAALRGDPR
jgi:NADP-dependent aldehyde dehydrogenase